MLCASKCHGKCCVHYLAQPVLDKFLHCLPHGWPAHTNDKHATYTWPVNGCKKGVLYPAMPVMPSQPCQHSCTCQQHSHLPLCFADSCVFGAYCVGASSDGTASGLCTAIVQSSTTVNHLPSCSKLSCLICWAICMWCRAFAYLCLVCLVLMKLHCCSSWFR